MKRWIAAVSICTFAALAMTAAAAGETKTIWEIGKFDHSIHEFSAPARSTATYEVGKSDWKRDWPADEASGSRYEIQFPLSARPTGVFTLKISTLVWTPRVPAIKIQINGHEGLYYLHPTSLYLGDQRFRSTALLTIDLPARDLTQGTNSLVLSLVDSQPTAGESNAVTISYDYLSLVNDAHAKYNAASVQATVTPTIFYRKQGNNLVEIVDAFLRFNEANSVGKTTLSIGGHSYISDLAARNDLGEERVEFEVPEWSGTVPGRLELSIGRHDRFPLSLTAERKWTVYVVPHTHVDIGYTDYQGKVAEAQADTLEKAAAMIHQHPDFRFATDGSWDLQQMLETRSAPEREDVLDLIRKDKIGLPAQYFNLLTGYASLQTLYRSLYYTKSLAQKYNLPFDYANITDVPSYTGSYPSVLASAGIKYWAAAVNEDRAPLLAGEQWNEKSPFWWEGPDGGKVLFWCSWGYSQIGSTFGWNLRNSTIREALPLFLEQYDHPGYKPDAVLMYGAQAENTDLHPELATFVPAWNDAYAYPRLRYSTFQDFFKYIDANYGPELATYRGDMGPYWEDGIGSDAYYAAEDRWNQGHAVSAEVASTVSHLVMPDIHPPAAEEKDAWNNILLFAEHTWGAGGSVGQPDSEESVKQLAVKDNYAVQAHFEVEDLNERALSQLARKIHVPSGTIIVFNPLNWRRDALIETDLSHRIPSGSLLELVDMTTQQAVPTQVTSAENGLRHIRFLAQDLPPVGYKCFQVRVRPGTQELTNIPQDVIENKYYRITIDTQSGAVRSIFDKELGRELVDANSPYRFGQYLYVTGGNPQHNDLTQMIHPYASLPVAQLVVHPATQGRYLGTEKTPWGYSIKLTSSDVNTPQVALEILLFNNVKRMEFRYTVQKSYTWEKEGVYFAFPSAVTSPHFRFASQQGWVDPAHDILKGGNVEWFTIQNWMEVSDPQIALVIVPVDAPLATFGDINRGRWPVEFNPKSSTIFSYAMNNYWHTNYRAGQGGTFTFRYVITSGDNLDPSTLSRIGTESMQPPEIDQVIGQDKVGNPDEPLPAEGTSFLKTDANNIVLADWKLAENGNGTILRLEETAGRATDMDVTFNHTNIRSASLCDSVEDNLRNIDVVNNTIHLTFRPHQVLTVRVTP